MGIGQATGRPQRPEASACVLLLDLMFCHLLSTLPRSSSAVVLFCLTSLRSWLYRALEYPYPLQFVDPTFLRFSLLPPMTSSNPSLVPVITSSSLLDASLPLRCLSSEHSGSSRRGALNFQRLGGFIVHIPIPIKRIQQAESAPMDCNTRRRNNELRLRLPLPIHVHPDSPFSTFHPTEVSLIGLDTVPTLAR